MNGAQRFFILCILVLQVSCAFKVRNRSGKELVPDRDTAISVRANPVESISVLYTGCGGLVITHGKEAIITDPYYTGHGLLRLPFGIKPDPYNVDSVFNKIDETLVRAVLVSHAHYDHLEDLPGLLKQEKIKNVKIMGSSTAACALGNAIGTNTFINATPLMRQQAPNGAAGTWKFVSEHIRVMPIEARHAPHFFCGIHLMRCKEGKCRKKNCSQDCCPDIKHAGTDKRTGGFKWKEGTTYSFLVDILSPTDTLRLFIQTSSCDPPYGFPPAAELNKKAVDVAFLCVASTGHTSNYPDAILSLIRPKHTVLVHWEDFFRNMYKNPKRVRATNLHRFVRNLRKHYGVNSTAQLKPFFTMPRPLDAVRIDF